MDHILSGGDGLLRKRLGPKLILMTTTPNMGMLNFVAAVELWIKRTLRTTESFFFFFPWL